MIYIYGSGGRGKLIKELLIRCKQKNKDITFIDDFKKKFKKTNYLLKNFISGKDKLFIAILDPKTQKKKYLFFKKKFKKIDNEPLVDPKATIKSKVKLSKNTIILENASIGPYVKISKNVFIGSKTIINHDSIIGPFSSIGHGANIAGKVKVDTNCIIGISSIIKQNVNVGSNVLIGSGSNVVTNCLSNSKYYGNPAKKHGKN